MTYTGGELNELNGKMGISAPYKSVPVMKLIKIHQPKSKNELEDLIEYHFKNKCDCGIISQGTVKDFGTNLYNSQVTYWKQNRYSLLDCLKWEYDLFIVQSLKGGMLENKAINLLRQLLSDYTIEETQGYLDEDLRIDIIISKNEIEIAGIQVKPLTFSYMRNGILDFQKMANLKWGKPVYFLFYDDKSNFINTEKIIDIFK